MLPHARKPQNGGTATCFGPFLMFGQFLPRNNVLLCKTETISVLHRDNCCVAQRQQCPCVAITQCPCVAITQSCAGGRTGGGRRETGGWAVAPTQNPLARCPPTHPRLLSPCWGQPTRTLCDCHTRILCDCHTRTLLSLCNTDIVSVLQRSTLF